MGMKQHELALYRDLIGEIKVRVRRAQTRAALSANAEMILLYWDIGRMLKERQAQEGWGAGVLPRLAADLKNELPEIKGFSERNMKRMVQFWSEYPDLFTIGPRPVAQLEAETEPAVIGPRVVAQLDGHPFEGPESTAFNPLSDVFLRLTWAHNIALLEKVKDLPTRLWYARQVIDQGWSRDTLNAQIKARVHERHGAAVTNFERTLPTPNAAIASQLLKDPYIFDFLTLDEAFRERELETGLLHHLQKFLLELGRGFAFVGRQYPLEVGDQEFRLDLLFYHLRLRCFVVADLKRGEFKPEYAGKMNFYCSVVDDQLRHADDAPTVGLILCQNKDRVIAEYALRDINKPIGVADYELTRALPDELSSSLPTIEEIEAEMTETLREEAE